MGLLMLLVIHYCTGDVQDSHGVSTFEMTYVVSGEACLIRDVINYCASSFAVGKNYVHIDQIVMKNLKRRRDGYIKPSVHEFLSKRMDFVV